MIGIKISPFSSFGYEKMMKFIFILLFIDFALCDTLFFRPKSQGSNPDSNPVCPDQQGKCPAKSTCCKLDTGQYGCCPLPNAVCCNDHVHCCPQGFTCDVGAQTCVQGSLTVDWTQRIAEPEPLHQDVVCPGEKVKCPSGSTCCQTAPQQFGCCPIKDAVCCSDEKHCCPKGYVCNNKKLRCDKKVGLGSLTLLDLALATRHVKDVDDSWYENEAQDDGVERAGYPQESVQARDDQVAAPIKLKNEITCPDNVSTCPDATTCCAMKDGYYGCCPYDSAVCCSDFLHCCPSTQQCNVTTGTCQDKMAAIAENDDDVSVLLSLLARKQDVQCPDLTSSCPAGTTCCELPNGGYGCCPYKDAVCCSDHVHCCEHGDTCDVKKGTCRKNKDGVEKPLAKKLPAKSYALMVPLANYQDIVCPDRNTSCPSGNTCCPYHIGSIYGCCPMPNAVCCNDHDHCCPEGYTCTSSGECTKTSDVTSHSSPRPAGNPDFTISVPEASKDVSDATLRWKQANVSPAPNPICPDQRSQCPSGSTCCPIGGGQYGCCPFPQAVCCDATYCCEHGYRCVSGQCYKDGVFKMAATKTPALPLNPTNQPRDSQVSQSNPDYSPAPNPICPDQQSQCPTGSTCCPIGGGQYGCCPFPQAVCCDATYCCEHGYRCASGQCYKDGVFKMAATKTPALPLNPTNQPRDSQVSQSNPDYSPAPNPICPDQRSQCPSGSTCCPIGGGQYGCCPFPQAVCCDATYCCEHGYRCVSGQCYKDGVFKMAATKTPALPLNPTNQPPDSQVSQSNPDYSPAPNPICPDQQSQCPTGSTCCPIGGGQYGCCPFPQAVCCDATYCCEHGYRCASGQCYKDGVFKMAATKTPALPLNPTNQPRDSQVSQSNPDYSPAPNPICPDQRSQCPSGSTCCPIGGGQYGCCPFPQAVCCDATYCCEHGYRCVSGQCYKDGVFKMAATKTPALPLNPTNQPPDSQVSQSNPDYSPAPNPICPDQQSQCPTGSTCCPIGGGQYGCCPFPQAVCCDATYCCEHDYRCASGQCYKDGVFKMAATKTPALPLNPTNQPRDSQVSQSNPDYSPTPNPICPDQRSQCPSGSTCCPIGGGQYGCCPFPQAVCCDPTYCCEHGNRCVSGLCYKDGVFKMAATKTPALPLHAEYVDCTDPHYKCPAKTTCCKTATGFGCCPLPQAVCCSDEIHCCPSGYTCTETQCTLGEISIPWLAKVPAQVSNQVSEPDNSEKTPDSQIEAQATIVKCPDGRSYCEDGNTCCMLSSGDYGCCPLVQAVCCDDHLHCCPNGYTCSSGQCYSGDTSIEWFAKVPSQVLAQVLDQVPNRVSETDNSDQAMAQLDVASLIGQDTDHVICPDQLECPSGSTCCQLQSGDYGCCNFPSAVCCSDHLHCCPSGYTCDVTDGRCVPDNPAKGAVPWAEKIPASTRAPAGGQVRSVQCPDGKSTCPSGNTCCLLSTNTYGCCPLPNAVCCGDGLHCCPSGTTCDLTHGTCVSATLTGDIRITWHDISRRLASSPQHVQVSAQSVMCPGGQSACPDRTTCCLLADGGYGCCPYPRAVCCADRVHCCPNGMTCNLSAGRCDSSSLTQDIHITWTDISRRLASSPQPVQASAQDVICPDQQSECPDGNTCCAMQSGKYACCPLPQAVCCSDHLHCCPNGHTCDVSAGRCSKQGTSLTFDWFMHVRNRASVPLGTKQPAIPASSVAHGDHVICPDKRSQCPSQTTCCRMGDIWGCCPYPSAICCSDGLHCCPSGYTCNAQRHLCRAPSWSTSAVNKAPVDAMLNDVSQFLEPFLKEFEEE